MGFMILLISTLILSTASAQSLDDPWLRDPMLVGLWKLTRAINSFGFNLFEDLTIAVKGNVLICPFSISTSLGILHFGSTGETEKELSNVLGYEAVNLTKDEAAQVFYMLSTKQLKSSNPKFYLFDGPSTIIVNRHNGLLPTFQRVVEVLFQAPITVAGFIESWDDLFLSINDWIAARTRNKIHHILEFIDPYADMIILNTAYLKGVWLHKFPLQETKRDIFYNCGSGLRAKEVHMMRMTNILNYYKGPNHSIVELPFKGRNLSMIIFLPEEFFGINELIYEFSSEFFEEEILKMAPADVDIVLPRFKIKCGADLKGNLKGLGLETLFHPEKVDLSEMIRRDSLTFGEVRHLTSMSVAENGVEAGAAKAIHNVNYSNVFYEEPDFNVNHPFMFVIYERRIKMILLVGRVMEV